MAQHAEHRPLVRRSLIVTLLLLLCLDLAVAAALVGHRLARESSPAVVPPPAANVAEPRNAPERPVATKKTEREIAVRQLLVQRATALRTRNRAAFLGTVDPKSPGFRTVQANYFDNLAGVPAVRWSYTLDPTTTAPTKGRVYDRYRSDVWVPRVKTQFRFRGFDHSSPTHHTYFTFVRRGDQWYIGSDTDAERKGFRTDRQLWDFGPVSVARQARALVLGHPDSRFSLTQLAAEVNGDVPRVSAVWGANWARKVVVLVPSSETELAKILDDGGSLTQIAAVATAEIVGPRADARPIGDRVLINPPNWAKLGPLGRQVVLTHELTHVATRPVTGPLVPTWLVEGFADYVGYRGTGVPVSVAARELGQDLAAGRPVGKLPSEDAYDGTNQRLAQAYEKAWLACRLIAERYGERALVRFYRAVGADRQSGTERAAVDRALKAELDISLPTFTRQWRSYVRSVL